jgi:xanthine dehydrogenase YagT iron-sulfur-binding subunit
VKNCTEELEDFAIERAGEDTSAEEFCPPEVELSRREFLAAGGLLAAGVAAGLPRMAEAQANEQAAKTAPVMAAIAITINGKKHELQVDTRTSLLDLLRETLDLTGSKKGCDHGQCGACTVLMDGRRINSCLTLAVSASGAEITTIEGLGTAEKLGPAQKAFLEHDGFQCGYCTPGQICSATALMEETKRGELSLVSWETGKTKSPELTDAEIKERMAGNICRCGAYPNIVAAVRQLAGKGGAA